MNIILDGKNITEEDFYKNFKKKSSELIVSNR